ncbi:acylphosphatase [bacterium]|nr:acylphosphatase [bacterium]
MKKAANILVAGRVQGVAFRFYTVEKANSLGITGWVKNLPNGDEVEIWAEGDVDALNDFVNWCYKGPSHSMVTDVKCTWYENIRKYSDFIIKY